MTILMWDKPARKVSVQEWKDDYGFEDGPAGGYIPNMSKADEKRWKAKLTGTKLGFPQVEIRKTAGASQMTIIVNLGQGYNYKQYKVRDGINVHVALNGPAQMTFEETNEMHQAIQEAKTYLEGL
jgi:hypothetical protein